MIGRSPSRLKCGVATHLFRRMVFGALKTVAIFVPFCMGKMKHIFYMVLICSLSSIAPVFVCPV